jgi:hypothetical protein
MGFRPHLALALGLFLLPAAAAANVLYKSVDGSGVVMFSDIPPPDGSRILEERPLPSFNSAPAASLEYGTPEPGVIPAEQMLEFDAAIASANAKVDEAERALARARRDLSLTDVGLRLRPTRLANEDERRLDSHRNNVKIARRHLVELLRERQLALRE